METLMVIAAIRIGIGAGMSDKTGWELERAINSQPWDPLPGMLKRPCD